MQPLWMFGDVTNVKYFFSPNHDTACSPMVYTNYSKNEKKTTFSDTFRPFFRPNISINRLLTDFQHPPDLFLVFLHYMPSNKEKLHFPPSF